MVEWNYKLKTKIVNIMIILIKKKKKKKKKKKIFLNLI